MLGGVASAVGYLAGAMVAALQIPQVLQVRRTGNIAALSPASLLLHLVTGCLWMLYGVLLAEIPIILANAVYTCSNTYLLVLVRRERDSRDAASVQPAEAEAKKSTHE